MARVVWAPQAEEDLEAICSFIARDCEQYAREFAVRILDAVEILAHFPEAGRAVPEFADPARRELLHGHYRIIYEASKRTVQVLAIHHGARLLRERPRG